MWGSRPGSACVTRGALIHQGTAARTHKSPPRLDERRSCRRVDRGQRGHADTGTDQAAAISLPDAGNANLRLGRTANPAFLGFTGTKRVRTMQLGDASAFTRERLPSIETGPAAKSLR